MQLALGGTLLQVFPVSVTLPSSAVPVKSDVMFVAVVKLEVFVIVSTSVDPFVNNASGEPVTDIVAVEGATTESVALVREVLSP